MDLNKKHVNKIQFIFFIQILRKIKSKYYYILYNKDNY